MSNSLVVVNPEERAHQKSELLRNALERLAERGVEVEFASALETLTLHVIRRESFDQRNPRLVNRAKGIVIVTLNLALEYATKGDVEKAANALRKNSLEKIFLIGEKKVQELIVRIEKVFNASYIRVVIDRKVAYYGISDAQTESRLRDWHDGHISDHNHLPPATMAEIQPILDTLDRVEREIYLAKKVDWDTVLSPVVNDFAARFFCREKRTEKSEAGGIWLPFLASLMVNALTAGYGVSASGSSYRLGSGRGVDLYLMLQDSAIVEFLELVMFEYEALPRRAPSAAAKIATSAFKKHGPEANVFCKPCTDKEVFEILAMAAVAMNAVAEKVRDFYMGVTSVAEPTHTELDRFWRTQLFIHSTVNVADRLIQSNVKAKRPWENLSETKNLSDVARLIVGFQAWPTEEQISFLKTFDVNQRFCATPGKGDKIKAIFGIWKSLRGSPTDPNYSSLFTRKCIDWTNKSSLVVAMCKYEDIAEGYLNLIAEVAGLVDWTYPMVLDAFACGHRWHQVSKVALRKTLAFLNDENWIHLIEVANNSESSVFVGDLIDLMDESIRSRHFLRLRAGYVAISMFGWSANRIVAFFEPLFIAKRHDAEFRSDFVHWEEGIGRKSSFLLREGTPAFAEYHKLVKKYLGRRKR
ncbi:MAG: DUF6178 family protein [Candidatus Uhrbacteria bacterium]|nr:DUF6178 family protein [Candidatus Uhrbacteria bacterium]